MIAARQLRRDEIARVWDIDRSEVIDSVYRLRDGELVLEAERHVVTGWPPEDISTYTPILLECFDRGGWFHAAFDGDAIAGVTVLDNKPVGNRADVLQLQFFHVSRSYRNRGLGVQLFELARATARQRGARRLYISATPSENTVNFYLRRGCVLAPEPDPELVALEPHDIHLECDV